MKIKILYAFVLVLLVALAIEGYLWTRKYYVADRQEENTTAENMLGEEVIKEEMPSMFDWKTYKNDELGLVFKYPPQMHYEEEKASDFQRKNTKWIFNLNFFGTDDDYAFIVFSVYDNDEMLTLDDWIRKHNPPYDPSDFEMVDFGSYTARKYTKNAIGNNTIQYVAEHKDKIIMFISAMPSRTEVKNIASSLMFDN